jgi:ketosteroid isomerase-like protein
MGKAIFIYLYLMATMIAAAQSAPQPNADQARILSLESAWDQALRQKDVHALQLLIGPEFVYVEYDGKRMSQTEYLSSVQSQTQSPSKIVSDSVKVQIYGGAGVVTGTYRETGVNNGKPYELRERFMDVWVRRGGSWVCVASQSTLIPR